MNLTYDVACLACGAEIRKGHPVIVISKVLAGSVITSYRHPEHQDAPDTIFDISFLELLG